MTIALTKTDQIVTLANGQPARIWQGQTETGAPITALVAGIRFEDITAPQMLRMLGSGMLPIETPIEEMEEII